MIRAYWDGVRTQSLWTATELSSSPACHVESTAGAPAAETWCRQHQWRHSQVSATHPAQLASAAASHDADVAASSTVTPLWRHPPVWRHPSHDSVTERVSRGSLLAADLQNTSRTWPHPSHVTTINSFIMTRTELNSSYNACKQTIVCIAK